MRDRPLPDHDRHVARPASLADERVDGAFGFAQTGDDRFISTDGAPAYTVVPLAITDEAAVDADATTCARSSTSPRI